MVCFCVANQGRRGCLSGCNAFGVQTRARVSVIWRGTPLCASFVCDASRRGQCLLKVKIGSLLYLITSVHTSSRRPRPRSDPFCPAGPGYYCVHVYTFPSLCFLAFLPPAFVVVTSTSLSLVAMEFYEAALARSRAAVPGSYDAGPPGLRVVRETSLFELDLLGEAT